MPFAAVRGIRLYYEVRGGGRPILFITGTGGDLRRPPNAFERRLAQDFKLLMFDQRGMGRSDKPDVVYNMADYAADAAGLTDETGWPRCPVLGYSFGGMVAQELALRNPQSTERLVLLSTTSGGAGGASYPMHDLAALPPALRAQRLVELGDTRRDATWQRDNRALFDALVADALAGIELGADEADHDAGLRRQLEARLGHDTWERLPGLSLPVSVFGGRYDGIAPPGHQLALARRIAGADFQLFEGGHLFFLQDPTAYPRIRSSLSDGTRATGSERR